MPQKQHATQCQFQLGDEGTDSNIIRPDDSPLGDIPRGWQCPRSEYEESDYCIFHIPVEEKDALGISSKEVRQEFLNQISDGNPEHRKFLGAKFSDLDLSFRNLSSNSKEPIDLRCAHIEGKFDCSHTSFGVPLHFDRAIFSEVEASASEFQEVLSLAGANVNGVAEFEDSVFRGKVLARSSKFDGDFSFVRTKLHSRAEFNQVTFGGDDTTFAHCEFTGAAAFPSVHFHGDAQFFGATFQSKANFRNAAFNSEAHFRHVNFDSEVDLSNTLFRETTEQVAQGATFNRTRFEGEVNLKGVEATGYITGYLTKFNDRVSFSEPSSEHSELDSKLTYKFIDSHIQDGNIRFKEHERLYFDLRDSTLGDVRISSNSGINPFSRMTFLVIEFRGFDFSRYRPFLSPEWKLNNEENIDKTPEIASTLEITYQKAKDGAKYVGDQVAVSKFFIQEMRYRRRGYKYSLNGELSIKSKLRLSYQYAINRLYDMIAVYGEKPLRVFWISIFTILLFSLYYSTIGTISGSAEGFPASWTEGLYFSIITFTTLGYGDIHPMGPQTRIFASLEAFTGSMLMALLIFVLGRQLTR